MEINPQVFTDIPQYKQTYDRQGFVVINNLLSEKTASDVSTYVEQMPLAW